MRIKSFFSDSTDLAIAMARRELGEEALILNSRSSPPEARHLGAFEVVFAAPEDNPEPRSETRSSGAAGAKDLVGGTGSPANQNRSNVLAAAPEAGMAQADLDLQRQIERLRKDLEGVFRNLTAQGALRKAEVGEMPLPAVSAGLPADPKIQKHPGAPAILTSDRVAEIPAGLLSDLTQMLSHPLRGSELEFRPTAVKGSSGGFSGKRIAFVGPSGAGKTSMTVNAALQLGLYQKKSVAVIGIDGERVAANEPLRTYCAIAGLPFFAAASPAAVSRLLQEHSAKDLLVVDCPAYSPKYESESKALARTLQESGDVAVHLVLSASYSFSDLRECLKIYDLFSPVAVAATRWDESRCILPLLAACLADRLPVRWANAGQSIPDDFVLKPLAWIEEKFGPQASAWISAGRTGQNQARPVQSIVPAAVPTPGPRPAERLLDPSPEQPAKVAIAPIPFAKPGQAIHDLLNASPGIALGSAVPLSSKSQGGQIPLNARLPFTASDSSAGEATSQQLIEEILRRFRPHSKSAEALTPISEQEHVAA